MPTPFHWRHCCFAAILLMSAAPAALLAQWPDYRAPGVPRAADGKVNMTAPTPKTPDGKPDLSGMWENDRPIANTVRAAAQAKAAAGDGDFFAGLKTNDDFLNLAKRSAFWNLGSQVKGGLPFTPWGAEIHRQRVAEAIEVAAQ